MIKSCQRMRIARMYKRRRLFGLENELLSLNLPIKNSERSDLRLEE
jgi:hypothetical protein